MGVAQQLDPEANRITSEAQTENFLASRRISIRCSIGFSHTTVAGVIECLIWAKGFVLRTYLLLDITSSVKNMCLVSPGRESMHKNYLHKEAHATDRTFGKNTDTDLFAQLIRDPSNPSYEFMRLGMRPSIILGKVWLGIGALHKLSDLDCVCCLPSRALSTNYPPLVLLLVGILSP